MRYHIDDRNEHGPRPHVTTATRSHHYHFYLLMINNFFNINLIRIFKTIFKFLKFCLEELRS